MPILSLILATILSLGMVPGFAPMPSQRCRGCEVWVYIFDGWTTESAPGAPVIFEDSERMIVPPCDVVLYAKWKPDPKFKRTSAAKSTVQGTFGEDAESVRKLTAQMANAQRIAAKKVVKYTVKYVYISGGIVRAETVNSGASPTKIIANPTRKNYTFAGWYHGSSKINNIKTARVNGNVTIHAKWVPKTYTVKFGTWKLSDGTTTPTRASVNVTYPNKFDPAKYSVSSVTGKYTFKGWNGKIGKKSVMKAFQPKGNVTLYPVFETKTYSITFRGAYGKTGKGVSTVTKNYKYYKEVKLPGISFKRTGFTTPGWTWTQPQTVTKSNEYYYVDNGGNDKVNRTKKANHGRMGAGNLTLWAVWEQNKISLIYYSKSNTGASYKKNSSVSLKAGQRFKLKTLAADHLHFISWNTTASGSGTRYMPGVNSRLLVKKTGKLYAQYHTGPTPLEAAYMAQHIYDPKGSKPPGDWEYLKRVKDKGLVMGLYRRKIAGGTEYAVVNRGTVPSSLRNWANNGVQVAGFSPEMTKSISKAKEFKNEFPNKKITFVGHSKGGAEAIANAIATNMDCVAFNSATVSNATIIVNGLKRKAYNAKSTEYIVNGDILDAGLKWVLLRGNKLDKRVYLKRQHTSLNVIDAGLKNHDMSAVISALKKEGYK